MLGLCHVLYSNESTPGIVLLAIGDIFHFISKTPTRQFLLRVSCMEIYNEQVYHITS
jgi:centromeric protein E